MTSISSYAPSYRATNNVNMKSSQPNDTTTIPKNDSKIGTKDVVLGSLATIGVIGMADVLLFKGKGINKLTGVAKKLKASEGFEQRAKNAEELAAKAEERAVNAETNVKNLQEINKNLSDDVKSLNIKFLSHPAFEDYKNGMTIPEKLDFYKKVDEQVGSLKNGVDNICEVLSKPEVEETRMKKALIVRMGELLGQMSGSSCANKILITEYLRSAYTLTAMCKPETANVIKDIIRKSFADANMKIIDITKDNIKEYADVLNINYIPNKKQEIDVRLSPVIDYVTGEARRIGEKGRVFTNFKVG